MTRNRTPAHWTTVGFGDFVSAIEAGKSYRCVERPPAGDEPGVVKISAVTWGSFDEQESKTCPDEKQFDPKLQIRAGDFLISRANTIELVGACVLVGSVTKRLMLSDKVLRLVMPAEMKRWSLWFLRSKEGRAQIEARATGNQLSMRNIGQPGILAVEIPVPPSRERRRIVGVIESCLTRLDDSVATLKRAQRNLQRYRASVLKAAVEGRLVPTEAELARAEGRSYEPASELLARIHSERRTGEQVAGHNEPRSPDRRNLPCLPGGWTWVTVDQLLAEPLANGRSVKTAEAGFPVLRLTALRDGSIDLTQQKIGAWTAEDARAAVVCEGDFLVSRGNGSIPGRQRWAGSLGGDSGRISRHHDPPSPHGRRRSEVLLSGLELEGGSGPARGKGQDDRRDFQGEPGRSRVVRIAPAALGRAVPHPGRG